MKKIDAFCLLMCFLSVGFVYGQGTKNPQWICGSWQNLRVSDLSASVVWTFNTDSVFTTSGKPSARIKKCLFDEYPGYQRAVYSENGLLKLTFTKENNTIVYEFLKRDDQMTEKPAFSYSLTMNGVQKMNHSQSADRYFISTLP